MKREIPGFFYILKSRLAGRNFLYEFYFKGKKTLDIGCGEGEFMKLGKDHISGVDVNTRVIERLTNEGFQARLSSGIAMPYGDGEFDMAHCHNVIEHMDVGVALSMLRESARILKKGGKLVLSSEVMTKKFWHTFGHVKPYPPQAVIKLLRPDSREEFEGLADFEVAGLFYFGDFFKNKFAYLVSVFLGYYTPILRREYFLVLRKK